jgi:hypothetical protein
MYILSHKLHGFICKASTIDELIKYIESAKYCYVRPNIEKMKRLVEATGSFSFCLDQIVVNKTK